MKGLHIYLIIHAHFNITVILMNADMCIEPGKPTSDTTIVMEETNLSGGTS